MISETLDLVRSLDTFPVFTLDDFSSLIRKDTPYSKIVLNRFVKKGLIERIQRDRYTTHKDPLIVATNIVQPSYISLWYALNHYHLTEQISTEISVLTTLQRFKKTISFHSAQITFTKIPIGYLFGYRKTILGGFEVFMADKEKAILDSMLLKRVSFPELRDIIRSNKDNVSSEVLSDFTIRSGNIPTLKRIGWIMEHEGLSGWKGLKPLVRGAIVPLDYSGPQIGKMDPCWGVMVNLEGDR